MNTQLIPEKWNLFLHAYQFVYLAVNLRFMFGFSICNGCSHVILTCLLTLGLMPILYSLYAYENSKNGIVCKPQLNYLIS
jgi:hypothetical protein